MNGFPAWRPIATAPKDGTAFLAAFPESSYVARQDVRILHWSGWGGGTWDNDSGYHVSAEPYGWMPLPPPARGCWVPTEGDGPMTWALDPHGA